jgi:hypothetical protein
MATSNTTFADLFSHPCPRSDDHWETWLLTAVAYPEPADAANAVAAERVAIPIEDSLSWLRKILEPPPDLSWVGLEESVAGRETLFTAWNAAGRLIQVAAQELVLHVRTSLGRLRNPADPGERLAQVSAVGNALFEVHVAHHASAYDLATVGPFLVGEAKLPTSYKRVAFATDGVGVKYTFPKKAEPASMKSERRAPMDEPPPWFTPPEAT